jgi:hypothetical protein
MTCRTTLALAGRRRGVDGGTAIETKGEYPVDIGLRDIAVAQFFR